MTPLPFDATITLQTTKPMKSNPILYKVGVVWGRMALPHTGHCTLIQKALRHCEVVFVHLSAHPKNNDYDTRVLLLRTLLRGRGVDLKRVTFFKSVTVNAAMRQSIELAPFNEVALFLGNDQSVMGVSIADAFDACFIENQRTSSSTEVRHFMAQGDDETLNELYEHSQFAVKLAKELYKEEIRNEGATVVA